MPPASIPSSSPARQAQTSPLRLGIVGLGYMAATHIRACLISHAAVVSALCNPSGRRLDGDFSDVGGNLGNTAPLKLDMSKVKPFRDYQEMITSGCIDAVDICTPTSEHAALAVSALDAGLHVLCEKPLARDSAQARQIADAARRSGQVCMPAMCLRFWPEWAWLKRAISENSYGRVLSAHFRRVAEPPRWGRAHFANGAASGGALLDLHIHDVDFVQYCFGVPSSVFASGYSKFSGAIDHVTAQYRVASGAMVSAEGAWSLAQGFGFKMAYTVNFEHATADYDSSRGDDTLRLFQENIPPQTVQLDHHDAYAAEIQHFADAILVGSQPSIVNVEDGVSAIRICEAEERSIHSHQPIEPSLPQ